MDLCDILSGDLHATTWQNQTTDVLIVDEGKADSIVNVRIQVRFDLGNGQLDEGGQTLTGVSNTGHILAHELAFAECITKLRAAVCLLYTLASWALQGCCKRAAKEL